MNIEYFQPVGIVALVIICLGLVRMLNGRIKNKVSRPECHQVQESIGKRIEDLDKHLSERFDDLKDFIKNGSK